MTGMLLVLTNVPDQQTATDLAEKLVSSRLAACVNCLPEVRSIYQWQGKIERASEVSLLIKTSRARYAEVERLIQREHPYDVPEIIAMPIEQGSPDYLAWMVAETEGDDDSGRLGSDRASSN